LKPPSWKLKVMNESSNVALAKMKEETKILMADMSTMDPLARAWYMMYHGHIGKEVMDAQAAAAAAAMTMPMPTMLVMDQSAMEQSPMMKELPPAGDTASTGNAPATGYEGAASDGGARVHGGVTH
jgi:hypothetical protein